MSFEIPMLRLVRLGAIVAVVAFLALWWPHASDAVEVIPPGDPSGLGFSAGVSTTQAGAHPDSMLNFNMGPPPTFAEFFAKGGPLKDVVVDLPPGFVGNPEVVTKCLPAELKAGSFPLNDCPAESQVGVVVGRINTVEFGAPTTFFASPLYAMQPSSDELALFGFTVQGNVVTMSASVRPNDHGLRLTSRHAFQFFPVTGVTATVWGVPSDPSHDLQRCFELNPATELCDETYGSLTPESGRLFGNPGPRRAPFLTNPTVCDGPKLTSIRVSSWYEDGTLSALVSDVEPTPTGCDKLIFDPSINVRPDSTKPDSPTGLDVSVTIPQNDTPDGLATPHLKDVSVTLPRGMSINPSSAGGLQGCTDAQIGMGTDDPVRCPEASKIGSVTARTPVLREQLEGSVYVGEQHSGDPESGDMFRILMALRGPGGLVVKLEGKVRADGDSGQLVTTFANNPQLPVETIDLRLKGGSRAPLATPPNCGEQSVSATLTSWAGQTRVLGDTFVVDCPGVGGFSPGFAAGTRIPTAGAFSPFALSVDRPDGQEYLAGLAIKMPTGLTARLRGVPLCGDALASTGSCPAESQVGEVIVAAGPGSNPFALKGPVSLTGPYKGAPYGLVATVRVVAGPFDLGTVVVRQGIFIDPTDAHIAVVSDSLPKIVKGVPIRLRSIDVEVNRAQFVLNPTSCAVKQIGGLLHSEQDSSARVASRFRVGDCQALSFKPELAMKLTGRSQTTVNRHPGLTAVVRQASGQANIKRVEARLPLSVALDPDNANGLCEFAEGQKADPKCPASSVIGSATARTPLLNRPLSGKVYFVKGIRIDKRTGRQIRTLPTLLVALRGEVAINVRATTAVKRGKLVSTFAAVPDAPISRFDLKLKGGRGGILVANRNLCRGKQVADVRLDGQNGRRSNGKTRMVAPCTKSQRSGGAR